MLDFEAIYQEYFKDVFRYLLSLTNGNRDLSEELTQETFFKAIKAIDTFHGNSTLYSWLCQISKNTYYNHLRKNKRIVGGHELDSIASKENVAEIVGNQESAATVRKTIAKLEEPYKAIVCLRIDQELSFKEIAEMYGQTENWARVTFHRAKNKIKEQIK